MGYSQLYFVLMPGLMRLSSWLKIFVVCLHCSRLSIVASGPIMQVILTICQTHMKWNVGYMVPNNNNFGLLLLPLCVDNFFKYAFHAKYNDRNL